MRDNRGALRIALLCAASTVAHAADWPAWRGPDGTGRSAETSGWPAGWPPQRLWGTRVGLGCTAPVIANGTLYVTGWSGQDARRPRDNPQGTDTLCAFDARTGRELWRQTQPARYQGRLRTGDTDAYGGPSATPTVDPANGRIFTLGADGTLTAWNLRDGGRPLWSLDLHGEAAVRQRPDVGGGTRDFGFTSAPRLHGGTLLVEAGAADGIVLAFDPATGARKWASAARGPAGHSGGFVPLPPAWGEAVGLLALDQLLVLGASDDDAGRVLARAPWATEFGCNIPTPAVHGDRIIVTSGYNQHRTVAFGRDPDGALAVRWETRVHAVVSSPVVLGDRVYVLGGSLACLDARTGATLWRGGRFGHGSMVATADDKLIVFGEGRLALVDAARDAAEYRELTRVDRVVPGTCYPHVAFADGLVACKDRDGNLAVYSIAPRAATPSAPVPVAESAPFPADGTVFAWKAGEPTSAFVARGAAHVAEDGSLDVTDGAFELPGVAERLLAACRAANTLAIDVTITTADRQQTGPARILTFSSDPYHRNFTLGQEGDRLVFRLRTPETGENGMNPETTVGRGIPAGEPQRVAVRYEPGRLTGVLRGLATVDTDAVQGDFSNWEPQSLLLGDEATGDRGWNGRIHALRIATLAPPTGRSPDSTPVADSPPQRPSEVPTPAPSASAPPPLPGVTPGTDARGRPIVTVATGGATFVFDLLGGGIASMLDPDGRDWVSHGPAAGARGRYRGIPNLINPEGGFHPGDDLCESRFEAVEGEGGAVATVRSATSDARWQCRWTFHDGHAVMDVEKAAHSYWFLYEGTPGSTYDETRTWMMDSAGTRTRATESWERRLPDPRWIAFGRDGSPRVLFVADATPRAADVTDSFWSMERSMTVFGFGRSLRQGPRWHHLSEVPARFVVGFVEATDHATVGKRVAEILREASRGADKAPLSETALDRTN